MRGNIVMKGYLKNEAATEAAFEGGWFHTGDLAVLHEDGYCQIADRSKDIIISGGENISSIEVQDVLCVNPPSTTFLSSPLTQHFEKHVNDATTSVPPTSSVPH